MYNNLFSIGKITVHTYGLMIAIGVIVAFEVATYRAKRKLDSEAIFNLGIACFVGGMLGAKVLFCIVELPSILKDPSLIISPSGFVVYGGIIGGITAGFLYTRIKKMSFFDYFDLVMPSISLAQGFGRIGCFFAGCCYGRETDSFIGIVFHNSDFAPNGIKLIPTQLISSLGDFILAFLLMHYAKRDPKSGRVAAMYLILYAIGRSLIEVLRDDYRGTIGVLSTSQFISMIIVLIGVILFFTAKASKKENTEEISEL